MSDLRQYRGSCFYFDSTGNSSALLSVSNDRTFKIWSIDRLECVFESPQLGQFSLTSSAILESGPGAEPAKTCSGAYQDNKGKGSSTVLALGNCDF